MERKGDLQHNKIHHLEDTMITYGVYNSDTLTELVDTVHRMYNTTTWRENLCRKVKSMVRTIFASRRHASLCHKFNTFPDHD